MASLVYKLEEISPLPEFVGKSTRSLQSLSFLNIGNDALYTVCTYLDVFDLLSLCQTCKKMKEVCNMAGLWKHNCQVDFDIHLQKLPGATSYYQLYKVLHRLHLITESVCHFGPFIAYPDSVAGFLLYRTLPPHLASLSKMDSMMISTFWQFSGDDMQKYDGRILTQTKWGHFTQREIPVFQWDDLYDLAIKLYGTERWQAMVLNRQLAGQRHLQQTVDSVLQKQRSSQLFKWIISMRTTSSLEHRDLSNYNPAVCQDGYDSDEPLRHPIVWDSYMNGTLFAGLRTVANYCECFKKLRKHLVMQPQLAMNKDWRLDICSNSLLHMTTYLRRAMYVDLVSSERMLRVAKMYVKAALQVYAIPGCTLGLYRHLCATSPYKNFFESQSEEDLEQIECFVAECNATRDTS